MAANMSSYKPAQIFAAINTDPPAQKLEKPKPKYTIPTKDNEIQVSATAEVSMAPDKCKLCVVVSNKKEQVQEVKNSVQRRLDYILQTLSNHQVKEEDIHVTKVLQRLDGFFLMDTEVAVDFVDFNKCQTISNLLIEKLHDSVKVSTPEFTHSTQRRENLRRQASLTAVKNAKQKAGEMARFLNAKVGQPIALREEYCNEWEGPEEGLSSETESPLTIQYRLNQATVHVSAKVSATFELRPKARSKEHKN